VVGITVADQVHLADRPPYLGIQQPARPLIERLHRLTQVVGQLFDLPQHDVGRDRLHQPRPRTMSKYALTRSTSIRPPQPPRSRQVPTKAPSAAVSSRAAFS